MSEEVIVKAIEDYFRRHPELKWNFGNMSLDSQSTITKLRKDKKFRQTVVDAVVKYSLERLLKGD